MDGETVSLVIDVKTCTACKACELACSFTKQGVFSPSLSRIHVMQVYDAGVNVPVACINCVEAPCIEVCPCAAILRDEKQGIVYIDETLCSGCEECIEACPYGAVEIPPRGYTAIMCDLCKGTPACVSHCIYGALRFENTPDFFFSALEIKQESGDAEERRWTVAKVVSEQVCKSWEVHP